MENFDLLSIDWDKEQRRTERAQAVADQIINSLPDMSAMVGFEYGCGTGLLSFNLQKTLKNIVLGDSSEGMLSVLEQKLQKSNISNMLPLKIDLTKDDLPEKKFDIIYTLLTLHHIVDIDQVLESFFMMLNPSGYLCIADLDKEDGSFHGEDFEGHHGFDRVELLKKLEEIGFQSVTDKICYEVVRKKEDGQEKKYPLFLMIVRKLNTDI